MRFFFYVYPHGPADRAGYEHEMIAIAEGLRELGHDLHSNVDYWPLDDEGKRYLLPHTREVNPRDCDVVIFGSVTYGYNRLDLLPADLMSAQRRYRLIFVDAADGITTPGYRADLSSADFILKCHYSTKRKHPSNFVPWQFGLTSRIIDSCAPSPWETRNDEVLVNFRTRHILRDLAERRIMPNVYKSYRKNATVDSFDISTATPQEARLWTLTGKRHYKQYYERLGSSKACAAFGGILGSESDAEPRLISWVMRKFKNRLVRWDTGKRHELLFQFDSWRFWESLCSGCLTLHADLAKYGARFPVMPVHGVDYVGIDFADLKPARELIANRDAHHSIAAHGREWALNHYSPRAVAQRLLQLLSR